MWSWLLILGTLIGYWVVLSCMVYVAKKAETAVVETLWVLNGY